jgi:hypothetical protein
MKNYPVFKKTLLKIYLNYFLIKEYSEQGIKHSKSCGDFTTERQRHVTFEKTKLLYSEASRQ